MNNLAYTIVEETMLEFCSVNNVHHNHKAQDEYCGYDAHQEVLDIDYEMCRPYNRHEEALLADYAIKTEGA